MKKTMYFLYKYLGSPTVASDYRLIGSESIRDKRGEQGSISPSPYVLIGPKKWKGQV